MAEVFLYMISTETKWITILSDPKFRTLAYVFYIYMTQSFSLKVVEKGEFNSVKLTTHGHGQTFDDNCSTVGTRDK